jgi:hypothetical protein
VTRHALAFAELKSEWEAPARDLMGMTTPDVLKPADIE